MATLQLLLNSALILIIATVLSNSEEDLYASAEDLYDDAENADDKNVTNPSPIPVQYNIEMTLLDFDTLYNYFQVRGECNIIIEIINPIISFKINVAPSMRINSGSLLGKNSSKSYIIRATRAREELSSYEEWIFENSVAPGFYTVQLGYEYTAYDNQKGFFRTSYEGREFDIKGNNIQWSLATNSWPNMAHQMFPCFELPGSRATFKITVKYNNNKYKVLTNMGMEYEIPIAPSVHMKHFKITPNISVYQVAILIYNFDYINNVQLTLADKIYSRNSDIRIYYAETVIANVTFLLQKEWQTIKDIFNPIVNYALIPGFPYDSADGWRLVFLREDKAIYNEEMDTFGRKIAVTRFLAQKVMYQWLGNIVSFDNWTNLWINDGVTIFYGMDAIDKIYPETQMWNLFVVQDLHESLQLDTNSFMKFRYSNLSSFDIDSSLCFVRYLKGPALIHMLYHMMTSDYFHQGVTNYLTLPSKQPTIEEFWRFMEEANKNNQQSKFKDKTVKYVMDTWTENNYPIINVQTNVDAQQKNIIVTVTQESNDVLDTIFRHKWWILITWFTDQLISYSDRITPSLSKWLPPDEESKTLTTLDSTNGWIIVNTKRNGYYRVSYDDQNWQRISQFLQSSFRSIHVLNRAQLIDDAFYFMLNRKLDPDIYFNLTKFLSQDTNYIAWYPMFKTLEYISPVFALYSKRIGHLKLHLLNLLVPLLQQIGYNEKPNEDKLTECLREEAVKWTCILGDVNCKRIATQKLYWHLENRRSHKLLPRWKKWTYCEGVRMGDSLIWHNMARVWNEERDDALLQYLMCSENYYIATQSFNTMKDESIIKLAKLRDDAIHFMFFLAKYSNHTMALKDILNDKFLIEEKPRAITRTAALVIVINNIYTAVGLEKVEKYTQAFEPFDMNTRILSKIVDRRNQIFKVNNYAHLITPYLQN